MTSDNGTDDYFSYQTCHQTEAIVL